MFSKKFHAATRNGSEYDNGQPVTILPGSMLRLDGVAVSKTTLRRWEQLGLIRKSGEFYTLTQAGYRQA